MLKKTSVNKVNPKVLQDTVKKATNYDLKLHIHDNEKPFCIHSNSTEVRHR